MMIRSLKTTLVSGAIFFGTVSMAHANSSSDLFIIKDTAKSPEALVASIKSYSKAHKWKFISATKVRKGSVTLVKVCIPEVGKKVWPQGLYLSALLPCGNIGIYKHKGKTQVSMLNADYMHKLVPTAKMKKVSEMAEPMLMGMLDAAVK